MEITDMCVCMTVCVLSTVCWVWCVVCIVCTCVSWGEHSTENRTIENTVWNWWNYQEMRNPLCLKLFCSIISNYFYSLKIVKRKKNPASSGNRLQALFQRINVDVITKSWMLTSHSHPTFAYFLATEKKVGKGMEKHLKESFCIKGACNSEKRGNYVSN